MLTTQIRDDMKSAMKSRDALRVDTLRGALSAFTNELVSKGKKPTEELSDAEVITVLKRLAKQRKDAIAQFSAGGRQELADKESSELSILQSYLPASLPLSEIEAVARAKKEELGITDTTGIGKLTGAIMKEFALAGKAQSVDGDDVKEVVSKLFS